jgi:anti-sigma regulatory factor (Ser/Thr protein kinase)
LSEQSFKKEFEITGADFARAGSVSTQIKSLLQEIGVQAVTIRRIAIATYEAEMNVVMYARTGHLGFSVSPESIRIEVDDEGQGIENIELAMQEGYSTATDEMREMGFGAGMGLPNIKRNCDRFEIDSTKGVGTSLLMVINL